MYIHQLKYASVMQGTHAAADYNWTPCRAKRLESGVRLQAGIQHMTGFRSTVRSNANPTLSQQMHATYDSTVS